MLFQRTIWHYEKFCKDAGFEAYPGDAKIVGACLSLRATQSKSVSMVEKLHGAIAYEHKLRFHIPPTDHPSLKLLMRSVRRNLSQPRSPVTALTLEHLTKMNEHLASLGEKADLVLWRTIWRLNVEYYTMCRFSEVNPLTTKELTYSATPKPHFSILIRKSKTDQLGLGSTREIYQIIDNPTLCPVTLTQRYLHRLASHNPGTKYVGYLQPKVRQCGKLKIQIPIANAVIGYSSCLEENKSLMAKLKISGRFGEHSGRRGGATAAAANGATLDEVQKLGGWKSAECANKYVDKSASQKDKISKLLYP